MQRQEAFPLPIGPKRARATFSELARGRHTPGMAALTIFIIIALVASFAFFLGGGPALVVLLLIALLIGGGWFVAMSLSGRRPTSAVRRTKPRRLLGPGGPDDPDRV